MTFFDAPPPKPADLWKAARAWLADALRRFGAPARIATIVARRTHNALRRRLAVLDSLLAKLLLIEAANLVPPASSRRSSPTRGGGRERSEREGRVLTVRHRPEDPTVSSTWRVRFHPRIPRARRNLPAACARAAAAPRSPAQRARALARRVEAIVRVLANPARAAATLARKLRALGHAAHAAALRIARRAPPRRRRCERVPHAHAIVYAIDACSFFHADSS